MHLAGTSRIKRRFDFAKIPCFSQEKLARNWHGPYSAACFKDSASRASILSNGRASCRLTISWPSSSKAVACVCRQPWTGGLSLIFARRINRFNPIRQPSRGPWLARPSREDQCKLAIVVLAQAQRIFGLLGLMRFQTIHDDLRHLDDALRVLGFRPGRRIGRIGLLFTSMTVWAIWTQLFLKSRAGHDNPRISPRRSPEVRRIMTRISIPSWPRPFSCALPAPPPPNHSFSDPQGRHSSPNCECAGGCVEAAQCGANSE